MPPCFHGLEGEFAVGSVRDVISAHFRARCSMRGVSDTPDACHRRLDSPSHSSYIQGENLIQSITPTTRKEEADIRRSAPCHLFSASDYCSCWLTGGDQGCNCGQRTENHRASECAASQAPTYHVDTQKSPACRQFSTVCTQWHI